MDYEKKYKEALGWMQSVYPTMTGADKEDAEHFFPELAESEDEKMRKELISLVKETKVTERYYDLSKMLAWLEKQDEQKPIDKIEQDSSWSEENDDDAWLNDIISKAECNLQLNKDEIDFLKSLKDRVQLQPKQEWSEEEKARIDRIIDVLDWAEDKGRISYSDWEDYVCYVKCLRPQSNTKWYKIDDRIQKEIINFFECQKKDEPTRKDTINKWIDWLKDRVLPRSQWKPSGEQIMAIDTAINVLGKGTLNGKQLIELYQDLKKLKGEEI